MPTLACYRHVDERTDPLNANITITMILVPISLPTPPGLFDPASGEKLSGGPRTDAVCGDDFGWAYNSVGTSPCLIVAEILGACNGSGEC